jgi:hypothetical protein
MENETEYYTRRAAEERKAAAAAQSPEAEQRHRTLAEHYARIAQQQAAARPMVNGTAD